MIGATPSISDARDEVESVLSDLDFDVLVNCAAYTGVDDAEDAAAIAVNAHAVQAMARICAEKRARLIHVSTDYVSSRVSRHATTAAHIRPVFRSGHIATEAFR